MLEVVTAFLTENAVVLGAIAAAVAIGAVVFIPIRWIAKIWKKPEQVTLSADTIHALSPDRPEDGPKLTIPQFIRVRRELKAELLQELERADDSEKEQLRARIAELESQIASPEKALAEAQKRISDLEALLVRSGNQIGGDRIAEARAALERGDYSVADAVFAEIEALRELDVQEAARAAFGRGEIAEGEVRWADAADHYARAARLDPGYDTLIRAGELLWRAGRYADAIRHNEQLVGLAKRDFGAECEQTAAALNNLALSYQASGRDDEAEPLFREALEIAHKTLGVKDPDYATGLNNLAESLRATGRYGEAEQLFRKALAITRKTLGVEDPDYARGLNNLALLLAATGRYGEAEQLLRKALAITRKTLRVEHPDYATGLNNLAGLLWTTGRQGEAEPLFREAVAVAEAGLGPDHPDTQTYRKNLKNLLAQKPG